MNRIGFFGGDARCLTAMKFLQEQGFSVAEFGIKNQIFAPLIGIEAAVFPLPCVKDGRLNAPFCKHPPTMEEVLCECKLSPALPAMGGPFPFNPFRVYHDLSVREDLKIRNAVTTAEGAIALAIEQTERSLVGAPCLVIGYGAIGKRLSYLLHALGAAVCVSARKPKDMADAEAFGYQTMQTASLCPGGFSLIFNTVPACVLTEEVLRQTRQDVRIIDLASLPGGVDDTAAAGLSRAVTHALALPSKVSPITAGEDLAKTVIEILTTL